MMAFVGTALASGFLGAVGGLWTGVWCAEVRIDRAERRRDEAIVDRDIANRDAAEAQHERDCWRRIAQGPLFPIGSGSLWVDLEIEGEAP